MSGVVSAPSQLPLLVSGLQMPIKLSLTKGRNLLVSEHDGAQQTGLITVKDRHVSPQGTAPPGSGRLTLVDRAGKRQPVLKGLPTSVTSTVPMGKTIFIQIGAWDAVLPGPAPGSEIPNPNPSSPILASVLVMHLPVECDKLKSGFSITHADHAKLLAKKELKLQNAEGQHATLNMLVKFPNFTPAPRPDVPNAVRGANPFGMVESGGALYLSDAAQNTVVKVDVKSGKATTLLTFPQMANPGGMPPTMDAVPDSIRHHGGGFLVPLLSGYPFPSGAAEIRAVGFDGTNSPFIAGLTSAIDILPVKKPKRGEALLVLEYSLNQNANAPGRLSQYDSPAGTPVVVAENLNSPTNMVWDEHDRTVYITQIFPGNIVALKL
jgi:hypothetical protein